MQRLRLRLRPDDGKKQTNLALQILAGRSKFRATRLEGSWIEDETSLIEEWSVSNRQPSFSDIAGAPGDCDV